MFWVYTCTVKTRNGGDDKTSYWVEVKEPNKLMMLSIIDWLVFDTLYDTLGKTKLYKTLLRLSQSKYFVSTISSGAVKMSGGELFFTCNKEVFDMDEYPYFLLAASPIQYCLINQRKDFSQAELFLNLTREQIDSIYLQLLYSLEKFQVYYGFFTSLSIDDLFLELEQDGNIKLMLDLPGIIYFFPKFVIKCHYIHGKINLTRKSFWHSKYNILDECFSAAKFYWSSASEAIAKMKLDSVAMNKVVYSCFIQLAHAAYNKRALKGGRRLSSQLMKKIMGRNFSIINDGAVEDGNWQQDIKKRLIEWRYE